MSNKSTKFTNSQIVALQIAARIEAGEIVEIDGTTYNLEFDGSIGAEIGRWWTVKSTIAALERQGLVITFGRIYRITEEGKVALQNAPKPEAKSERRLIDTLAERAITLPSFSAVRENDTVRVTVDGERDGERKITLTARADGVSFAGGKVGVGQAKQLVEALRFAADCAEELAQEQS